MLSDIGIVPNKPTPSPELVMVVNMSAVPMSLSLTGESGTATFGKEPVDKYFTKSHLQMTGESDNSAPNERMRVRKCLRERRRVLHDAASFSIIGKQLGEYLQEVHFTLPCCHQAGSSLEFE